MHIRVNNMFHGTSFCFCFYRNSASMDALVVASTWTSPPKGRNSQKESNAPPKCFLFEMQRARETRTLCPQAPRCFTTVQIPRMNGSCSTCCSCTSRGSHTERHRWARELVVASGSGQSGTVGRKG